MSSKTLLHKLFSHFQKTKNTCVIDQAGSSAHLIILGDPSLSNRQRVTISLAQDANPRSNGRELWLLDVIGPAGCSIANWEGHDFGPAWKKVSDESTGSGYALVANNSGELAFDLPVGSRLEFLQHSWSGTVNIQSDDQTTSLDLYADLGGKVLHYIRQSGHGQKPFEISDSEKLWISEIQKSQPDVIAVLHPEWRGVKSATENLIKHIFMLDDTLDCYEGERIASIIAQTGCKRIVYGGFPQTYIHLVNSLKKIDPGFENYVFWLSSFLQTDEDYAWKSFQLIDKLCRQGDLKKWGFAKKGMAETVARTGVNTGFIKSCVRDIPVSSSSPDSGGPHLGIWALAPIWRKTPYAMLAAAREIDNSEVFVVGQDLRAKEFAQYLGLNIHYQQEPVPQNDMVAVLGRMHVNLYVTLSECSPMLPLESLAAGAPCLFGPTSHLFEDNSYLHSRLVVPYPDRSDCIATYIKQALKERDQIIEEYKEYAINYNKSARKSLIDFLGLPDNAVV